MLKILGHRYSSLHAPCNQTCRFWPNPLMYSIPRESVSNSLTLHFRPSHAHLDASLMSLVQLCFPKTCNFLTKVTLFFENLQALLHIKIHPRLSALFCPRIIAFDLTLCYDLIRNPGGSFHFRGLCVLIGSNKLYNNPLWCKKSLDDLILLLFPAPLVQMFHGGLEVWAGVCTLFDGNESAGVRKEVHLGYP